MFSRVSFFHCMNLFLSFRTAEIEESEYQTFYTTLRRSNDPSEKPLAKTHFVAEGEVTFKSLLFVPPKLDQNHFQVGANIW